ncbi:bifunctional 3'-5' exonuclease/DNA polymerase [Clavibacter tessellarius]|uniref:bifunctional 3'-5' exonuclease/DNA polymerase n=1 Tax=Clavibacter tessellarius TaxID=31965 RepID=UPI0039BF8BC5
MMGECTSWSRGRPRACGSSTSTRRARSSPCATSDPTRGRASPPSASAPPTRRAGCSTTRARGRARSWPRASGSRGATTCGSATRSSASPPSPRTAPSRARRPGRGTAPQASLATRRRAPPSSTTSTRPRAGPPTRLLVELRLQLQAVAGSAAPGRLRLLLAAESAGALVAAEMEHDGLPWDTGVHDALLVAALGPRPAAGGTPAALQRLAARIRDVLRAPDLNVDSPPEVLRALRRAGIDASSTRQWELQEIDHPVIAPLLEHKKLSRLLTANGWTWMETWIHDGRFHPGYVPGGVVTGRWAASGGGALQLPRQIRSAVRADPGWRLVVADAAQLEPRILAALAEDRAMADAGRGTDLYQGLVDAGVVDTRAHAKVAMLGAMYGATSGESGRLMPRLVRAYPRATGYVEQAARAGRAAGSSARGSAGPRRRPPTPGATSSSAGRAPRRRRRTPLAHVPRRATRAASPATSSSRAPPPSGRSAGSPACVAGWRRWSDPDPVPTSSSSCTTRSWCTRPTTASTRCGRPSPRPPRRPGACSSAMPPSTSP